MNILNKRMVFDKVIVFPAGAFAQSIGFALSFSYQKEKIFFIARSKEKIPRDLSSYHYCQWTYVGSSIFNTFTSLKREKILVLIGCPVSVLADFFFKYKNNIHSFLSHPSSCLVLLSKGMYKKSSDLLFKDIFYKKWRQFFVLSGPSFAAEILNKAPTIVSLAGYSFKKTSLLSLSFNSPFFKAIPSNDITGVLLLGALKNSLAIGYGILEGLQLSSNISALFAMKAFQKLQIIIEFCGGKKNTLFGPSGIGDFWLTLNGPLSRNKRFGILIAQNKHLLEENKISLNSILHKEKILA